MVTVCCGAGRPVQTRFANLNLEPRGLIKRNLSVLRTALTGAIRDPGCRTQSKESWSRSNSDCPASFRLFGEAYLDILRQWPRSRHRAVFPLPDSRKSNRKIRVRLSA